MFILFWLYYFWSNQVQNPYFLCILVLRSYSIVQIDGYVVFR